MCYHPEFGRSVLKDVGIITGEPQQLRRTPLSWDGKRLTVIVGHAHTPVVSVTV